MTTCANCKYNDGNVYTSNPPMYRCKITGKYRDGGETCDPVSKTVRCFECSFFYQDNEEYGRCRFHRDENGKMEKVHMLFYCAYGMRNK